MKTILILMAVIAPQLAFTASDVLQPIEEIFEPKETFDLGKYDKVAVIQWNPGPSPVPATEKQAQEVKMRNALDLAVHITVATEKGAKLVILPEFTVVGYPDFPGVPSEEDNFRNREDIMPYVEPVGGPTTQFFSDLARRLDVSIQFGMAEVDPQTDKYYNSAVIVSSSGNVIARHRKVHLFEHEVDYLSAGDKATVFMSPWGVMGMIICSDVYDSKVLNEMASLGVNVVNLSTSWAQMNSGMSQFRNSARRLRAYLLAANHNYFPDSGVINPDGTNQSHIRQTAGIAYGYIPKAQLVNLGTKNANFH